MSAGMSVATWIQLAYIASAACFVLALKWLSAVPTARRGVLTGVLGMALAVGGTLLRPEIVSYTWIATAFVLGTLIGVPMAMMPMTAVPQRTALSHAFGALAAALVGTAEYISHPHLSRFTMGALAIEVVLGFLTFTASLMAFGKLQEWLPQRPITYRGQNVVNLGILTLALGTAVYLIIHPGSLALFLAMAALALVFGVLLIIPIGGADMPTVISLLNAYAGLAASAMGFALDNKLLIIAGALDGSSGLILSIIMCKAMNRSFANVLFGAFGQAQAAAAHTEKKSHRSASAEEAASLLANAGSVIIIPGYGMAVAQAQHKVRELYDLLKKQGVSVVFAIHPVAGRMPGHMNVLLAEANVPYESLRELAEVNPEFATTDIVLVVGANDVVNPAAKSSPGSPIYGMPILEVVQAQQVVFLKRSMRPGFAGIENELLHDPKTTLLFGDAKDSLARVLGAVKAL